MGRQSKVDRSFEVWFDSLVGPGVDGSSAEHTAAVKPWFRRLFDVEGPVSPQRAAVVYRKATQEAATVAVVLVRDDIERTTSLRPVIAIDDYEGSIRISYDGSWTTPSVFSVEPAAVLVEVAAYLQGHVMEDLREAWPPCPHHAASLHPGLHRGTAVWECQRFQHSAAAIGSLGQLDR